MKDSIGNKIYTNRKRQKITQRKLAEILDVSERTISRWENSESIPDYETVILLSEILKFKLIDEEEKENNFEVRMKNFRIKYILAIGLLVYGLTILALIKFVPYTYQPHVDLTYFIVFLINTIVITVGVVLYIVNFVSLKAEIKGEKIIKIREVKYSMGLLLSLVVAIILVAVM